ncbi:MAG TPA: DUF4124 domain-containing protein [Rudaea sp.]|jgi:hypothetical protein|nr:DUF4124 domain-containing protein [Rudaea sp.]
MQHDLHIATGRSMRWYEWLAGLFLLSLAFGVRAGAVYKCVDASGAITFQDQICAAVQAQNEVEIAPAPAFAPSPKYAIDTRTSRSDHRSARFETRGSHRDTAYECRASDGRVFYRLGACPRSLAADGSGVSHGNGRGRGGSSSVSVSGQPIPREEACAQMRRAGSIGRGGHEFDEHVSTYDKNLGRDPCA